MKRSFLILGLFFSYFCNAQNYQCLKPATKNFFSNGGGYLRLMRIDSVRMSGGDTIYYPYHTPRGSYGCAGGGPLDSTGGSWLGKRVIQQADGTFLFDNIWNDTVVIKTQAHLGDTWSLFNDTTHISYKATLTAIDTMTILGAVDSVKKITVEADSGGIVNRLDPVNNFQIILSKHNGFAQVFDLYTFPYHRPDSIKTHRQFFDYYLDLILGNLGTSDLTCFFDSTAAPDSINSIFHLISFYNPMMWEIYNFAPVDILETNDYQYNGSMGYSSTTILDTLLSDSTTAQRVNTTSVTVSGINITTTNTGSYNVYTGTAGAPDTSRLLNFSRLPEEWKAGQFYYYSPYTGPDSCPTSNYSINQDNINYTNCSVRFVATDFNLIIGYYNETYGIGWGQTGISTDNYTYDTWRRKHYIYTKRNGIECGTFSPLSVEDINRGVKDIRLYPNPTNNILNITASTPITEITITNLLGQTLSTNNYNTDKAQVDVSGLPNGVYLIKINGLEVRKFIKE